MVALRSLGVYADLIYARRGGPLVSNEAFAEYLAALAERVDRVVVFGRLAPDAVGCEHPLGEAVGFVELPYYESVADLPAVYRTLGAAGRAFRRHSEDLDGVWLFGPHPVALRFVKMASLAGMPVALGVRQDHPAYMRNRLTGAKRLGGVPYFDRLERRWRALARELPTLTAGEQLARAYGGPPTVAATAFSLVRAASVAVTAPAARALGDGEFRLLSVGRLDREKNPLLLPAVVARLRALSPDTTWGLTVVGDGPMGGEVRAAARDMGVDGAIEYAGYVPFGNLLDQYYRGSDLLLHVSHTEGLPQVLIEAMASGLPIVATDVGGVAAALAGTGALLVPPDDAGAAARAVIAAACDTTARALQADLGLARARELTVEAQQAAALAHIARLWGLELPGAAMPP